MTEKFQISKRLDDGTIIVVGGDSYQEFTTNIHAGTNDGDAILALFDALIPVSAGGGVMQQAIAAVAPIAHQQQPAGYGAPAPAPAPLPAGGVPNAGGAPQCPHGVKQWKTGTGQNGREWKAWMCPSPKGTAGQCPPEWVR